MKLTLHTAKISMTIKGREVEVDLKSQDREALNTACDVLECGRDEFTGIKS